MKYPVLNAETRKVLGKKVKKLRREGILPANVYGKGLESKALQVKLTDFNEVYDKAGETSLVDLKVEGKSHPVLIKSLQIDYARNLPMHADFYQVNLKEKVRTMVPVIVEGEAKAVVDNIGVLLTTLAEVEIEALPDRIPEHISVNVESLAQIDDSITVGDLKTEEGIEILTDPGVTVVKIAEPAKEEEPEVAATEETTEGGAKADGATAEDKKETKDESATKTEEAKK